MNNAITFSAPGSLMLLGEHAVLHGKLAVVCAVNRRVRATLTPRADRKIEIHSALGNFQADLDNVGSSPEFRFVLAVIKKKLNKLPSGFDLKIESEFSHKIGFGSSAAVTVAVTAAFAQWTCGVVDSEFLFGSCRDTIREVQGVGSGADVAASVFGGVTGYRADPLEIFPFAVSHPLTAVYSGSKMPTVEVIGLVEGRRQKQPALFDGIFSLMEETSREALAALETEDWPRLGAIMNFGQGLMDAIGVNNEKLARIIFSLRADPEILGAKISGSGLGDCAVGLGRARENLNAGEQFAVEIDTAGVRKETI